MLIFKNVQEAANYWRRLGNETRKATGTAIAFICDNAELAALLTDCADVIVLKKPEIKIAANCGGDGY